MAQPNLSITDSTKAIEIFTSAPILATDIKVQELLANLNNLKSAIPSLTNMSYKKTGQTWFYKFWDTSRTWTQKVVPAAALEDYTMTFDVPDYWKLAEFVANRPVRDAVFTMQLQYGLSSIEVTFT